MIAAAREGLYLKYSKWSSSAMAGFFNSPEAIQLAEELFRLGSGFVGWLLGKKQTKGTFIPNSKKSQQRKTDIARLYYMFETTLLRTTVRYYVQTLVAVAFFVQARLSSTSIRKQERLAIFMRLTHSTSHKHGYTYSAYVVSASFCGYVGINDASSDEKPPKWLSGFGETD